MPSKKWSLSSEAKDRIAAGARQSWSRGERKKPSHKDRVCLRCGSTYVPKTANAKYCLDCRGRESAVVEMRNSRQWCQICQRTLTPANRATDHCHVTGMVRGILCTSCNAAIGMLGVNPETYAAARAYVMTWNHVLETHTLENQGARLVYDPVLHKRWSDEEMTRKAIQ